jgi:hypothetical protein
VGAVLGNCIRHSACIWASMLGGNQLATVIQPRTVNIIGGLLFLLFGAAALYEGPEHAARRSTGKEGLHIAVALLTSKRLGHHSFTGRVTQESMRILGHVPHR